MDTPQASKITSILPTNGTEFAGALGRKVIFELDPSLGFVDGRHSYLSLDVLNTSVDYQRLAFEGTCGAASLINRIDTYAMSTGQLLESIENYNQVQSFLNQYLYEDTTNISALEGCGRDVQSFTHDSAGNVAHVKPYWSNVDDSQLSPITTAGVAAYQTTRFTTGLKIGLFRWYDDARLCPVMMLSGLRVEITLEDPKVALRAIEGEVSGAAVDVLDTGLNVGWTDGNATTISTVNTFGNGPVETGFAVGNNVTVAGAALSASRTIASIVLDAAAVAANSDVACNNLAGAGNTITSTGALTPAAAAIVQGDMISVSYTVAATPETTVTRRVEAVVDSVAIPGNLDVTVMGDALPIATGYKWTKVQAMKFTFTVATAFGNDSAVFMKLSSDNRSYRVAPQLKVVSMPPPRDLKMSETNYQFTSYDTFIDTLPSSSRKHQQEIPSVATKAVAINTMYVKVGAEANRASSSYFSGAAPVDTKLNSIQYYINNTLSPVQAYDPNVKAERVINQNENVKALSTINREPKCLGATDGKDLDIYTNTYLHSRELARNGYVFDLKSAEPQIRLGFSGTRADQYTMYTTVWSKKIINISNEGLRIIL